MQLTKRMRNTAKKTAEIDKQSEAVKKSVDDNDAERKRKSEEKQAKRDEKSKAKEAAREARVEKLKRLLEESRA
jgi:hypothetical protein